MTVPTLTPIMLAFCLALLVVPLLYGLRMLQMKKLLHMALVNSDKEASLAWICAFVGISYFAFNWLYFGEPAEKSINDAMLFKVTAGLYFGFAIVLALLTLARLVMGSILLVAYSIHTRDKVSNDHAQHRRIAEETASRTVTSADAPAPEDAAAAPSQDATTAAPEDAPAPEDVMAGIPRIHPQTEGKAA